MAEEEAGSQGLLEELGEHRSLLVEEGVEEAHSLGVVVVEEVGLLFLVMEEEVEQCRQGEEEEEGVGVEELLNQKVMVVEVEERALSLLVVAEEEVVGEEVPLSVRVKDEGVLLLLAGEVEVEAAADMNTWSHPPWAEAAGSHSLRPAHCKAL